MLVVSDTLIVYVACLLTLSYLLRYQSEIQLAVREINATKYIIITNFKDIQEGHHS